MAILTVEAVVEIKEDRQLIVQLPPNAPLGRHRVVAVLEEDVATQSAGAYSAGKSFPTLNEACWPPDMPLTRQEMYDDGGR